MKTYRRRSLPGDFRLAEQWVASTIARLKKRRVDPEKIMVRYNPQPRASVEVVVG